MVTVPESTVGLLPDPVAVCTHINRLHKELKIARRLLRLSIDAYGTTPVVPDATHSDPKAEARTDAAAN
jgi:hypothetical protein